MKKFIIIKYIYLLTNPPIGLCRGVELGSTKKQLQLSDQSGTWTRDLRISSLSP